MILKKNQIMTMLALLSTTVLLGACSAASKNSSDATTEATQTKKTDQEIATEDAQTLLNALLTSDDKGFSRLYGQSYDTWTEKEVFPEQAEEAVSDNGWSPEEDYTFEYAEDSDALTPTQVITNFLKSRRDNLKDIDEFEIKEVTVDGDLATITVESRHINNIAAANAVSNLYLILFNGNLDIFAAMNQANTLDAEFKKVQTLVSYFLYQANFDNLLVTYSDVPARLNETPLTVNQYEVNFDLEKNDDGHWVISTEHYRSLVGDLMNDSEKASEFVYPDGTEYQESETDESTTSNSSL